MNKQDLRLELIRLTHHHGSTAAQAVERAKTLETYVLESEGKTTGIPERKTPVVRKARQPAASRS